MFLVKLFTGIILTNFCWFTIHAARGFRRFHNLKIYNTNTLIINWSLGRNDLWMMETCSRAYVQIELVLGFYLNAHTSPHTLVACFEISNTPTKGERQTFIEVKPENSTMSCNHVMVLLPRHQATKSKVNAIAWLQSKEFFTTYKDSPLEQFYQSLTSNDDFSVASFDTSQVHLSPKPNLVPETIPYDSLDDETSEKIWRAIIPSKL